jgi:hypothetical protein
MTVSTTDMTELARLETLLPPDHDGAEHMRVLETVEEVIAWVIADCRASGDSEVDAVEMLIRHAQLSASDVRDVERTLRKLGYRDVCDRLRDLAGRRRHGLKPLNA